MKLKTVLLVSALAVVSAGAGYLIGHATKQPPMPAHETAAATDGVQQVYTCSMHPQIRLNSPGQCPICEMPLIPVSPATSEPGGVPMLQLSDHALAMASVETALVARQEVLLELRAVGKIDYNESSLATITARVDGYAERLFVNFTGVELNAGDHLAEVYSPDLLVAQQELLIVLQSSAGEQNGPMVEAAKLKLLRLGLTAEQIQDLVENKRIAERVTLQSPIQGTVIEKLIVENSVFRAGDPLYRIANLDTVWVYLDIYEYDLAWVRYGQRVAITAEALPGREFTGLVTFVQPIVNDETRTVRVPVHVESADHALKPGMFVSAVIQATLGADGMAAPTSVEGMFTCPMHPQVLREEAGKCPVCEMPLEQIPGAPPAAEPSAEPGLLVVPASAVLDSGTRRIVFVEKLRGQFELREVVLGPRSGASFPVLQGLAEGERVVTRGGFLIDSQFQINGHPSLFYPGGLMAGSAGHEHGGTPSAATPAAATPAAATPPAGAVEHPH